MTAMQSTEQMLDSKLKPLIDRLEKLETEGFSVSWSNKIEQMLRVAQEQAVELTKQYIGDEVKKAGLLLHRDVVVPLETKIKAMIDKLGAPAINHVDVEVEKIDGDQVVVARLQRKRIWVMALWLWAVNGVKNSVGYVLNGVSSFFRDYPFVIYLATVAGVWLSVYYSPGIYLVPLLVKQQLAVMATLAASAWMFFKSQDEWKLRSVSGGLDVEAATTEDPSYPLRAQAALKMAASVVVSMVVLGRLIALMPGLGLAVLVASLIGVSLVAAFSNKGDAGIGGLVAQAAARV